MNEFLEHLPSMMIAYLSGLPINVFLLLPWIAFIIIPIVWKNNRNATLIEDKNRAFTCSLFMGIFALAFSLMAIQKDSMFTLWFESPIAILASVMIIICIAIITGSLSRHNNDIWIWLLELSSFAHVFVYVHLHKASYGAYVNLDLLFKMLLTYAGFTIITALGWFVLRDRYRHRLLSQE